MKTETTADKTKATKWNCILFSPLNVYIQGALQFVVKQ